MSASTKSPAPPASAISRRVSSASLVGDHVVDHDVESVLGQGERDAAANSPPSTGHQRHLSLAHL